MIIDLSDEDLLDQSFEMWNQSAFNIHEIGKSIICPEEGAKKDEIITNKNLNELNKIRIELEYRINKILCNN